MVPLSQPVSGTATPSRSYQGRSALPREPAARSGLCRARRAQIGGRATTPSLPSVARVPLLPPTLHPRRHRRHHAARIHATRMDEGHAEWIVAALRDAWARTVRVPWALTWLMTSAVAHAGSSVCGHPSSRSDRARSGGPWSAAVTGGREGMWWRAGLPGHRSQPGACGTGRTGQRARG
ncbi:hypothetical protein GCM10010109_14810 [Actinoplanes campanulatus]|nr:hypothetical protein GCM10010109_14810 [Actinoplanes campanulatus]GID35989.1 hypothetical protein Aca09nite_24950 [Actinoplanes campanulatus]